MTNFQSWTIILFFVVFGFVILTSFILKRKQEEIFNIIAQRTGLQNVQQSLPKFINLIFGLPYSLNGIYKGRNTFIGTTYEGFGKNKTAYFTIIIFYMNNAGKQSFTITEENFFTKTSKKIGIREVQVGNPQFDERFYISGNKDFIFLKNFLSPLQSILINFPKNFKLEFNVTGISFKRKASLSRNFSADEAIRILNEMIRIIEIVEARK